MKPSKAKQGHAKPSEAKRSLAKPSKAEELGDLFKIHKTVAAASTTFITTTIVIEPQAETIRGP